MSRVRAPTGVHSILASRAFTAKATGPSVVLHAIWHIKMRLFGHGGVANPRDTYGYRCGLRLALTKNPSFLFVPSSMQHHTSGL
ncbi:hypothetical protein Bpro_3416 [Polaromonas sp. JS666]|nr:hypothetical protein Bpro_3416 [Polaromonas sp. JS666]